ncbi:hypothetical protein RYX36_010715 [Vicia faba]
MQQQGFDSLRRDHTKHDSTAAPKLPHDGKTFSRSEEFTTTAKNSKPGHRRSASTGSPLIYSGGLNSFGSTSSPTLPPTGNICPSGKILRPGLPSPGPNRTDVLGSGTVNYGHGSIVRGASSVKSAMRCSDPEEVKRAGNEMYRNGKFAEALVLYDRAVALSPGNAVCRSNRAAALMEMGRLSEAAMDCEEAVKLDPAYARAHKRLASLYLRFGQVENAQRHLRVVAGVQDDRSEENNLLLLEQHLKQCADARKNGDWKRVIGKVDDAVAAGADFCPQLVACKAEAHMKLRQFEDAKSCLSKIEGCPPACSQAKFFGMVGETFVHFVTAQVEMALGRFENAVSAAEKASVSGNSNVEVTKIVNVVRMVARARSRGNDLFRSSKFSEACKAYGEGLLYDNSNYVLYCNRAICWHKLGKWENSVQDCNQALNICPNYTKALLRRAASNAKLERWDEVVRDYRILKQELPNDNEVAENLGQALVALEKSRKGVNGSTKLGVEVEEMTTLDKLKAAIAFTGVSVVYFKESSNELCEEISPFINTLCVRYPSIKFIKVDVEECISIAKAESIKSVPTFKIYKNGEKVKEMIRPNHQFLEDSIRKSNNSL